MYVEDEVITDEVIATCLFIGFEDLAVYNIFLIYF